MRPRESSPPTPLLLDSVLEIAHRATHGIDNTLQHTFTTNQTRITRTKNHVMGRSPVCFSTGFGFIFSVTVVFPMVTVLASCCLDPFLWIQAQSQPMLDFLFTSPPSLKCCWVFLTRTRCSMCTVSYVGVPSQPRTVQGQHHHTIHLMHTCACGAYKSWARCNPGIVRTALDLEMRVTYTKESPDYPEEYYHSGRQRTHIKLMIKPERQRWKELATQKINCSEFSELCLHGLVIVHFQVFILCTLHKCTRSQVSRQARKKEII